MTAIIGAGGGGKGGSGGSSRTPKTAPDSLDSRQYANVIDAISEGEIEGLVDDGSSADAYLKSIYFNDTPIKSASGSYNFKDVTVYRRNGTQTQDYIPLSIGVENEVPLGTSIVYDVPQTFTVTNTEIDAVRITIAVPALQRISSKTGDTKGTTVEIKIEVSYAGGAYQTVVDASSGGKISGRTGDEYRKDYEITLARPNPSNNATFKVTRLTADSESQLLSNATTLYSYTEIVYAKLRYPNTALCAFRIDAEQFSSIPTRKYFVKGIKVRIPNGVTVDQQNGRIIYPENFIWDGTFAAATWCACPSWILYDLLTSTRFGLGDHILTDAEKTNFTGGASRLDRWAFFAASKYANQLVDTGLGDGSQEARFSCNATIQTAEEAYKLINDLLSVMRCQAFWSSGGLTVVQDAPADAAYLFTIANVGPEGFSYSGSSLKQRPNVVSVSFLDIGHYDVATGKWIDGTRDIAYEVVEDVEAIDKYGVQKTEVSAFACTSRGQAHRIGAWMLYSERYEKEVVSFTVGVDAGYQVRPGQIIKIADPVKRDARRAGRIAAATTLTVTVDDTTITDLSAPGGSYLSVILPDGTVERKEVSTATDGIITVQSPFTLAPNVNSIWMLESFTPEATTWRVLGVEEQDGINYVITALAHDPSKYAYIEAGKALQFPAPTNLNRIPESPTGLSIDTTYGAEQQYVLNNRIAIKVTFKWLPVKGIKFYRVKYRHEDENFTTVQVQGPTFDVLDAIPGVYEVQVSAISASGVLFSEPALITYTVSGLGAPPADVTGLSLTAISETQAILTWNQATDLDVQIGGKVVIRHDPRSAAQAEWASSNIIIDAVAGTSTQKQVPLVPGTYLVKFEDYLGNRSINAAQLDVTLPNLQDRLTLDLYVAETYVNDYYYTGVRWRDNQRTSPFDGAKSNATYDGTETALLLSPNLYVALDYNEPIYAEGELQAEYVFHETLDLGATYDAYFYRYIVSRVISGGLLFDSVAGNFDDQPGFFDGATSDVANVRIYIRSTPDNPSGTPTWGEWNEVTHSVIRGRAFQCKAVLTVTTETVKLAVEELGVIPQLLQRITSSQTPQTASTITYDAPFYDLNALAVTPLDLQSTESYTLSNVSSAGFAVAFSNAAGTVTKQYGYTATGYGRQV